MKTIVHVNQHIIKSNRAKKENKPVLTCKTYKTNTYAHEVLMSGPCRVVYRPNAPLSCGAQVWIETDGEITTLHNVKYRGKDYLVEADSTYRGKDYLVEADSALNHEELNQC